MLLIPTRYDYGKRLRLRRIVINDTLEFDYFIVYHDITPSIYDLHLRYFPILQKFYSDHLIRTKSNIITRYYKPSAGIDPWSVDDSLHNLAYHDSINISGVLRQSVANYLSQISCSGIPPLNEYGYYEINVSYNPPLDVDDDDSTNKHIYASQYTIKVTMPQTTKDLNQVRHGINRLIKNVKSIAYRDMVSTRTLRFEQEGINLSCMDRLFTLREWLNLIDQIEVGVLEKETLGGITMSDVKTWELLIPIEQLIKMVPLNHKDHDRMVEFWTNGTTETSLRLLLKGETQQMAVKRLYKML